MNALHTNFKALKEMSILKPGHSAPGESQKGFVRKIYTIALILIAFLVPLNQAHAYSSELDEIISAAGLNPLSSEDREMVTREIHQTALAMGNSYDEELHRIATESRNAMTAKQKDSARPPRGFFDKNIPAGKAERVGDIFYSSNSTIGIPHGHTAIYVSHYTYVEATTPHVRLVHGYKAEAPKPVYKYYVGWSWQSPNKYKAANFAKTKIGKSYNYFFWNNKTVHANSYNCSQLVWAAYKSTDPNVDLDSDGGPGVYPTDIQKSHWVHHYETRW